jgi:hypothetical protein
MKFMDKLYNFDFYAWTQEQSELLRQQAWDLLDTTNLIEEIESLGRRERQELGNCLGVLLGHLLKWQYQPEGCSNSWLATIREQRRKTKKLLQESPSLQPYLTDAFQEAYESGRDLAVRETNLPYERFPEVCPYTLEQALSADFFPQP